MVKPSCSDMQKGTWNEGEGEDEKGIMSSKQHGTGNWTTFSKRSVQRKSGKNSKEKWISNQKTDPKHKIFTPQEEELVIQLHAAIGSRWPIIAQQLPGKTDNDVKILWNSKLRKKLSAMGIDPVTHKPFSQILADYGNIGGFPKARTTRFTSLSRDLKNAIMFKSDQPHKHHFSSTVKIEPDHPSLQLYSQLQAVNLVTEASNYCKTEHYAPEPSESIYSSLNQEISSFSWSDFFLEDAFLASDIDLQENVVLQCEEMDIKSVANSSFGGASSSSNSSSFVEAIIGSQDDEMFSHVPCSYEDTFYY